MRANPKPIVTLAMVNLRSARRVARRMGRGGRGAGVIMLDPMIAVSDLGKSYGPQTLFEGVSIQFNPGNRYGLVGANGSGKSTFLRILTGEEGPSAGTVSM